MMVDEFALPIFLDSPQNNFSKLLAVFHDLKGCGWISGLRQFSSIMIRETS